jgi:hypothetical protein
MQARNAYRQLMLLGQLAGLGTTIGIDRADAALITRDITFVAPIEQAYDWWTDTLVPIGQVASPPVTEARGEVVVTFDPTKPDPNLYMTSITVRGLNFETMGLFQFRWDGSYIWISKPIQQQTLTFEQAAQLQQQVEGKFKLEAVIPLFSSNNWVASNCCGQVTLRTEYIGGTPHYAYYTQPLGHVTFSTIAGPQQSIPEPSAFGAFGLMILLLGLHRYRAAMRLAAADLLED